MHVEAKSDHPMTDPEITRQTGRGWAAWFDHVDAIGGRELGRRAVTEALARDQGLDPWWSQTIAVEYEAARKIHLKDGRPKGYAICVTKTIAAPVGEVFDAFGQAAPLKAWLGTGATASFTEGGGFSNADGNTGRYIKLARPKKLRFSWDEGDPKLVSTVEVTLTPKGDKCGLVLNHERIPSRPLADGLRAAWGGAIERLKRHLEG